MSLQKTLSMNRGSRHSSPRGLSDWQRKKVALIQRLWVLDRNRIYGYTCPSPQMCLAGLLDAFLLVPPDRWVALSLLTATVPHEIRFLTSRNETKF
jgi:hypothetical protein